MKDTAVRSNLFASLMHSLSENHAEELGKLLSQEAFSYQIFTCVYHVSSKSFLANNSHSLLHVQRDCMGLQTQSFALLETITDSPSGTLIPGGYFLLFNTKMKTSVFIHAIILLLLYKQICVIQTLHCFHSRSGYMNSNYLKQKKKWKILGSHEFLMYNSLFFVNNLQRLYRKQHFPFQKENNYFHRIYCNKYLCERSQQLTPHKSQSEKISR